MVLLTNTFAAAPTGAAKDAIIRNPATYLDKGLLECDGPDVKAKTCDAMAEYKRSSDGTYAETDTYHWQDWPHFDVIQYFHTKVEGSMACTEALQGSYEDALILLNGKPLSGIDLDIMRKNYVKESQQFIGHKHCMQMRRGQGDSNTIYLRNFMDGKPSEGESDDNTQLIWVSPQDGYKVR